MSVYAVDHHDPKSERRRKHQSVVDHDAVARFRFRCVEVFRAAEGTMQQRVDAVTAAITAGAIPTPPASAGMPAKDLAPVRLTLQRWDKKAGIPPEIERLRDAPRSGRPRVDWSPGMTEALEVAAGTAQPLKVIVEKVQAVARQEGRTPPSENTVKRAFRRLPPEFRRIARHGPHAAKSGALRHGAVAAELPLEWLSLDYAELPILVRAQGKTDGGTVKPGVVLIVDWFSGVIVGYQLVDPSLRARTGSYVTEDVHAAMCGVLYPEFSRPACAAYSGWMPMGVRFDRASMHNELRAMADVGVQIPNLPGYTPHRNGKVEATHLIIKRLVDGFVGSTQRWRVLQTDGLGLKPGAKKPATAYDAQNLKRAEPERWRLPCRLDDLPTFGEFAEAFDDIVAQINHAEVPEGPAGGTTTRHHRFMAHRRLDRLRAGRDGWPLLEVLTCRVESKGIRFHQIGRMATVTRDGHKLEVGSTATIRLHPLWQGAFVLTEERYECVPPHADWARGVNPAMLAYEHNQARRAARGRVEAAHYAVLRQELGEVAAVINSELETVEQQGRAADGMAAPETTAAPAAPDAKPSKKRSTGRSASEEPRATEAEASPAPSAPPAVVMSIADRLRRAAAATLVPPTSTGRAALRGPVRRPAPAQVVTSPFPQEHSA